MSTHDTPKIDVSDYPSGTRMIMLPPARPFQASDVYTFSRRDGSGESVIAANSRVGRHEFIVPDELLDAFVDAMVRLRDQRDDDRGHQVVESLRGTEDGIALAKALERNAA